MNFVEPLDVFFASTAEFAESATYTHGVTSSTISGVFHNPSEEALGIKARFPRFQTKASNVASVAKGDTLVLAGVTYKVADWEFDATGLVITLDLERQ